MSRNELEKLPLDEVRGLYHAYNKIIECIEFVAGGPYNVGPNGEYWSAVQRRNMCRQCYNERLIKESSYGDGQ